MQQLTFAESLDRVCALVEDAEDDTITIGLPPASLDQDWDPVVSRYTGGAQESSPQWGWRADTYAWHYLSSPEDTHIIDRHFGRSEAFGKRVGDKVQGNVPEVIAAYGRRAPAWTDLSYATARLMLWIAGHPDADMQLSANASITLINCSFGVGAYDETASAEAFAGLFTSDAPHMQRIHQTLNKRLEQIFSDVDGTLTGPSPNAPLSLRSTTADGFVRAAEAFDKAGVLSDSFWAAMGIVRRGCVVNPELLPLVYAKLTEAGCERRLHVLPEDEGIVHLVATRYIGAALRQYADDPYRNARNVQLIRDHIRSQERASQEVDLYRLTDLSNQLVGRLNTQRMQSGATTESELMAPLDPVNRAHTSDAFVRLLRITRGGADVPHDVAVAQLERDILHGEMIGLLFDHSEQTSRRRAMAALAITSSEVADRLATGMSLEEATEFLKERSS